MPIISRHKTFEELRDDHLLSGRLYEDPDFPATYRSLSRDGKIGDTRTKWLRPPDIVPTPQFMVDGPSRFDLQQGGLGNCWFMAGAACVVASNKRLFQRVVPHDQGFTAGYAGIFHFHLWHYGEWEEVVIDDRLPTQDGHLLYGSNVQEPSEFWPALLEKAYAKFYGTYESIVGGVTTDALVDMTGGISELLNLTKKSEVPAHLYTILHRTFQMNSLLGCSIMGTSIREEALPNGLYRAHAYSITGFSTATYLGTTVELLRIRNPWGKGEWNGPWSDRSVEWLSLSPKEREGVGLVVREDGEFWMNYTDWVSCFESVQICHLYPDGLTQEVAIDMKKKDWHALAFHGEWIPGFSAGGCGNAPYEDLYWKNPQYRVNLPETSEKVTMVLSLMQKGPERGKKSAIGYQFYRVKLSAEGVPEGINYKLSNLIPIGETQTYRNLREITGRHVHAPGNYVIIPSTFEPNEEGRFLLRVYTEKAVEGGEVDEPTNTIRPEAEEDTVEDAFRRHAGEDLRMDALELKNAIDEHLSKEYDVKESLGTERARALLAMLDPDNKGYVILSDFREILKNIDKWKLVFDAADADKSSSIDTYELYRLFKAIGFSVSRQVMAAIVRRYGGRKHRIDLQDYICLMARLVSMYDIFKRKKRLGSIKLSLEEWLSITLTC